MAYVLSSTTLKRPTGITEYNSTQVSQQRTLDGSYKRDYFGDNKRKWILEYRNTNKTDYDTANTIYQAYLADETAKTWEVTETNYTISQTSVHVDLLERDFSIRGLSYISDFDIILTEA